MTPGIARDLHLTRGHYRACVSQVATTHWQRMLQDHMLIRRDADRVAREPSLELLHDLGSLLAVSFGAHDGWPDWVRDAKHASSGGRASVVAGIRLAQCLRRVESSHLLSPRWS